MKRYYKYTLACLLFGAITAHAQDGKVGVNVEEPNRTYEIEGGLRVRQLQDVTGNPSFSQVLLADETGNIDKIDLATLKDEIDGLIPKNEKVYYLGSNPDPNKKVTVGKFEFYFEPSGFASSGKHLDVMMRLTRDPGSEVSIFYTLFRKFNYYDRGWNVGSGPTSVKNANMKYYKANHKTYNSSNFNEGQRLCPGFDIGDFAETYLSYPEENKIYRIVFYARQNEVVTSGNNNNVTQVLSKNYTILVEEF